MCTSATFAVTETRLNCAEMGLDRTRLHVCVGSPCQGSNAACIKILDISGRSTLQIMNAFRS